MFWSRSEYFVRFYIYFFVVVQSLPGAFLSGFSVATASVANRHVK